LVAIVVSALICALLFSLSFMTIIPLLKVMMGEEDLHSWVDRKTCDYRYGMDFYVPDKADFTDEQTIDIAYYLLITDVAEDGIAEKAGLRVQDRIVGVTAKLEGGSLEVAGDGAEKVSSSKLLEMLSTTQDSGVFAVQVVRLGSEAGGDEIEVSLAIPTKDGYVESSGLAGLDKLKWQARWDVIELAHKAVSYIPRGQVKSNKFNAVFMIIVLMGVVTIGRCITRFIQAYLAEKVVQISIARLREDAFSHVMHMPAGFFSSEGTSDTTSRIIGDTATAGRGVKVVLGKALREPLKAFFCLVLAMGISVKLALIFLCAAPMTIGLLGLLGKKIRKATKKSLVSSALMLGRLQGAIGALRVVKVYNRQDHECEVYTGINRRFLRQVMKVAKVQAATGPIMEVLGMIAGSSALLVGAYWICSPNSDMESSSFFVLLALLGTAAESIRKVSDVWNKIQQANAASDRVYEIIDQPAEKEAEGAIELSALREQIEFRDVVFSYPGSERAILDGVNLTARAGQTVAVVGPNGSGKTTLVNLIPRFYDVDSGEILVDGVDIAGGTLKSLRDQIGMVTQNVVTFNDTVAANISYGKPGATRDEIIDAAKKSFAHEFIETLPDGYDTEIGEHGSGFSGGQLQRIVIARAILKDPAILIFDEAMSQVDAESESRINEALAGLMENRTCFVIAHRFSTVVSADVILVIDEGKIAAEGRHDELIQSCELYKGLYETQLMAGQ
jgi:ABC-type multidrug transport system fused ATPase/permease subunit